jgi:amidase
VGGRVDETVFGSALEAAEKLRGREVSARELVDAVFTEIEKVNPRVNAVVELRREAALDEARAADEALAVG